MLDSDRAELLEQARAMLVSDIASLPSLVATLRQMHAGYPAGGDGGGGRGSLSRTETAALNSDPARSALRKTETLAKEIHGSVRAFHAIVEEWLNCYRCNHPLEWHQKNGDASACSKCKCAPGTDAPEGEPGCEIVARCGTWEPVFRVGDVKGNLPREYQLGRFAYEFTRRYGRLPTRDEVRAHLAGKRVRVKADGAA